MGNAMQLLFSACLLNALAGEPQYLEDLFELPPGMRLYRAAGPELSGRSYDLAFDGEGRLLVGDGAAVRRLADTDGDGLFDRFEVIAAGLGPRGPQGLLVWGDRLYAAGGDGLQLFEGYLSGGPLVHRGRLGGPFHTGGDHDAHTILRGFDGHLYFITGNGGGTEDRLHITAASSPALFEREGSVFRLDPEGKRWECIGSGARNAPNLGLNYLGEFFSLDSDMEWHVDLPWYRPVRLNHWPAGGDQGWREVGAFPPYYLDCLGGIGDVGRGSPDWGLFYEHRQLPDRYRDSFLVCDYLWKSATTGDYDSSGRLLAFFLERDGACWKASMEVLARPKPGARDPAGRPVLFAAVDIEVAPDGSLFISEHNQGIWRIFYDPDKSLSARGPPPVVPAFPEIGQDSRAQLQELLSLPQPASERSRRREEKLRAALGDRCDRLLEAAALDAARPLAERLRAIRCLAPRFAELAGEFLGKLAGDPASPEVRAQAAWLLGIRGRPEAVPALVRLLGDADPLARRRAAEALARLGSKEALPALIERLKDPDREVAYAAMLAAAHRPTAEWIGQALERKEPEIRMRLLAASRLRREQPPAELVQRVVAKLLEEFPAEAGRQMRLDLLRILGLFQKPIQESVPLRRRVEELLLGRFPDTDRDLRREEARLLGEYGCEAAFPKLLAALETEREPVAQFHLAQALCRLPAGWSESDEERLGRWFLGSQRGWFAQFSGKGLEFPHFWATVLSELGERHGSLLLRLLPEVDLKGLLGEAALQQVARSADGAGALISLYRANEAPEARAKILRACRGVQSPVAGAFLREEYLRLPSREIRHLILRSLAAMPPDPANLPLFKEGLLADDLDTSRACALALVQLEPELDEALAGAILGRLLERPQLFHSLEKALIALGAPRRPRYRENINLNERPEAAALAAAGRFWKDWYEKTFQHPFEPALRKTVEEKSDEEIHQLLLGDEVNGGDAERGKKVFEAARCASCHAGGNSGQIFGPDLNGVVQRLNRQEIADALVYPSKQVADRYKARVVQPRGGVPLTGFITEETEEAVTLATQEEVRRLPRKKIQFIAAQSASLMPERLLNRLSLEEIRDLYAFLSAAAK